MKEDDDDFYLEQRPSISGGGGGGEDSAPMSRRSSQTNTEDGFYDAHEGITSKKGRNSSLGTNGSGHMITFSSVMKTENPPPPSSSQRGGGGSGGGGVSSGYVQLSNLAGLSSPSLSSQLCGGKEGSIVSSLSSLSDAVESHRKLSEDHESLIFEDDFPGPTLVTMSRGTTTGGGPYPPPPPPPTTTSTTPRLAYPRHRSDSNNNRATPSPPAAATTTSSSKKKSYGSLPRVVTAEEEGFVFRQVFHPAFPSLLKVKVTATERNTVFRDHLHLQQEIRHHQGPIWTMKFSPNGLYLATGGQDGKVFIFCVAQNVEMTTTAGEKKSSGGGGGGSGGGGGGGGGGDSSVADDNHSTGSNASDSTTFLPLNDLSDLVDPSKPQTFIHSFLNNEPYRVLEGHIADVIDLSWSKSCFILSASVDKTIRLWHVSRNDCLQYFRHPDIVTAVEFHPLHDRYFISGCFDRKLRVWDIIPDGTVREWLQASDTITAVGFTPDGGTAVAGLIQGQISFFEYDPLRYKTQIECKNHAGRYKRGTKVTGLVFLPTKGNKHNSASSRPLSLQRGATNINNPRNSFPRNNGATITSSEGGISLGEGIGGGSSGSGGVGGGGFSSALSSNRPIMLVTTNDNRLRLCRLDDYSCVGKCKGGLKNKMMQIRATFSEDGRFIICGSDTGTVHIWQTRPFGDYDHAVGAGSMFGLFGDGMGRNSCTESWENTSGGGATGGGGGGGGGAIATTAAIFAPLDAVHSFLQAQYDYLDAAQNVGEGLVPGLGLGAGGGLDEGDLCSRVIVTADAEGVLRVYCRALPITAY
eukprot:scaffold4354_cov196-Ochromonas_danica.AAC.4